jgi:hypothetical protein
MHQLTDEIRLEFLPGFIGRCLVLFGNARTYGIYIFRGPLFHLDSLWAFEYLPLRRMFLTAIKLRGLQPLRIE